MKIEKIISEPSVLEPSDKRSSDWLTRQQPQPRWLINNPKNVLFYLFQEFDFVDNKCFVQVIVFAALKNVFSNIYFGLKSNSHFCSYFRYVNSIEIIKTEIFFGVPLCLFWVYVHQLIFLCLMRRRKRSRGMKFLKSSTEQFGTLQVVVWGVKLSCKEKMAMQGANRVY